MFSHLSSTSIFVLYYAVRETIPYRSNVKYSIVLKESQEGILIFDMGIVR